MNAEDFDTIKALLIDMRIYVMHHGVPIGECAAWNKLKAIFGVGTDDGVDADWLRIYHKQACVPHTENSR